jgi:hypothetical protein
MHNERDRVLHLAAAIRVATEALPPDDRRALQYIDELQTHASP